MSTADADDEKTVTGPPAPGRRPSGADDDAVTGIDVERRRGRAAAAGPQPGHMLPLGTRLRDYEITGLIGEGGFGIVYLAWDHSLQRRVAIKEYMPASMAARLTGSSAIVVKSERHLDTFRAGLKSFVNEARLLARFDHPSLVKVYRFWEENGTAYMVMPYYEGPTLKAALAALDGAPGEDELRAWLQPLLDALELMHRKQCYHRDIAPDNILLTPRGPLLLDFGAARRVIGDMTHAITVVLKPGYAPIEQYGDVATMAQGAWTDLYALASVIYYAITGRTPTSSVERLMDDRHEPLAVSAAGRYSDTLLRAVDAALAVRPADRPQNVDQFRALLGLPPSSLPMASDSGWSSGWGTVPAPLTPEVATQLLGRGEPATQAPRAEAEAVRASSAHAAPPLPSDAAVTSPRVGARRALVALAIAAVVIAIAIAGWRQPRSAAPVASRSAASAVATPVVEAPPAAPVRAPPEDRIAAPAETQTEAPAPSAGATTAATTAATAAVPAPLSRATADSEPSVGASAAAARAPRPRRETAVPRSDSAPSPSRTPPSASNNSRCSDILQKASLEPLTASEAEYLRRECR
jgi:hypothetical protein